MTKRYKRYHVPYAEVKDRFRAKGCQLLTEEANFVSCSQKVEYIAKCGHKNTIVVNQFNTGRGVYCKKCCQARSIVRDAEKLERVLSLFNDNGCTLLTPQEKLKTLDYVEYIPKCGHGTRKMLLSNFKASCGLGAELCLRCVKNRHNKEISFTEDKVEEILKKHGCTLIPGGYLGSDKPVSFIAKCGHTTSGIFSHVRRDTFNGLCKECSNDERIKKILAKGRDRFKKYCDDNGCELIEYNGMNSLCKLRCACGHITEVRPNNFVYRQPLCQKCSAGCSEKTIGKLLFSLFGESNVAVQFRIHKKRPFQYLDFYIPGLKIGVEYNGAQHYEYIQFFYKTEDRFKKQIIRDCAKRKWCSDNGITLVELDGRKHVNNVIGNSITIEWLVSELEKQTGFPIKTLQEKLLQDSTYSQESP